MLTLHSPLSLENLESHMVFVEGGEFELGFRSQRRIVRIVDFEICRFQVSQKLWYEVMGENAERLKFKNPLSPIDWVSWDDIHKDFLPALREKTGNKSYCLPTEPQWEYSAQGGKGRGASSEAKNRAFKYAGSNHLREVGWYGNNSFSEINPTGIKRPNTLGLYDLSGSLWEWCEDDISDLGVVFRGGSWDSRFNYCGVSYRTDLDPDFVQHYTAGFRLCRNSY